MSKLTFKTYLWLIVLLLFVCDWSVSTSATSCFRAEPQKYRNRKKLKVAAKPRVDYTRFSHRTHVEKQKLACSSCHAFPSKNWKQARKAEAAFPDVSDFPEHPACLNCHREQFFARERPAPRICSNCHISVTPRDASRYLFPSLADVTDPSRKRREIVSEFGVSFPHDKHVDVVGLNAPGFKQDAVARFTVTSWWNKSGQKEQGQPKSCPVCHQTYQPQSNSREEYVTKPPNNLGDEFWLKKGTFKTTPNSHTGCFTCHSTDSGIAPAPSECNSCHKLSFAPPNLKADFDPRLAADMGITDKTELSKWRGRISSGTFRHEGGEHPNVSCIACHNVTAINTLDIRTRRVVVGSCGGAEGCHITPTTDEGGILNYEIDQRKSKPNFACTKCHVAFGKEGVPANHIEAIAKATKKQT